MGTLLFPSSFFLLYFHLICIKIYCSDLQTLYSSLLIYFRFYMYKIVDRRSSVGIVTCYRLDGLGLNPGGGRDFPYLSRPALGPNQPPIQWVPSLSRDKVAGA